MDRRKEDNIITVKIRIWGIVQGVGFRPFVAKLAKSLRINGEVQNVGGLLEIILTDTEEKIEEFLGQIKEKRPKPSEIVHIKKEIIDLRNFKSFNIIDSQIGEDDIIMIPSDLAVCDDCVNELFSSDNPRYKHPFISCMACGPRYTIMDKIPYDRENTSMIDFVMCSFCEDEYKNQNDRRYHAQTISCHNCGPQIFPKKSWLKNASELISMGNIIALKGIGGYNFLCSPFHKEALKKLREVKGRYEKPFAVMFKDIEEIRKYCIVTASEEALLTSSARPIVLLKTVEILEKEPNSNRKDKTTVGSVMVLNKEVCRSSRFIGAFLPSHGAQYMLLDECGPLVVTSANLSDEPIIKNDKEMLILAKEEALIKTVFYNKRKIITAVDDSVVRIIDGHPQMIRRSKGYAPIPIIVKSKLNEEDMILATGGHLKSAFSISKGEFAYVSQYFGDLNTKKSVENYKFTVKHLKQLFRIKPSIVVCDKHPNYETTNFSKQYSKKHKIKLLEVQHHHAHIASVIAEHNISEAVIGVAFDGTGYGDDGAIWGGEFLVCHKDKYERKAHIKYFNIIGGDDSMKDAKKTAMCYLATLENEDAGFFHLQQNPKQIQKKFVDEGLCSLQQDTNNIFQNENLADEIQIDLSKIIKQSKTKENKNYEIVKTALRQNINIFNTSSMGRLFDVVASLLDIRHLNSYEGESAIMLENAAYEAMKQPGKSKKNDLALEFHKDLAKMILQQCKKIRTPLINKVALSGGVFQNKILMEETLSQLRGENFEVYYNISVPPNDGGICLGQNYIGMKYLEQEKGK